MDKLCAACFMPIPKARLEAIPWMQHCTLCATEIELQKTQVMARANEYLNEAFKLTFPESTDVYTPEQAADDRADNLLCRQIDRIEGFDESQ